MADFFQTRRCFDARKFSGIGPEELCWDWKWIVEIFGVAGLKWAFVSLLWLKHNEGHSATRGVGRVQHGGRLALAHQQPLEQRTAGRYKGCSPTPG
jgi:hypothetical protein